MTQFYARYVPPALGRSSQVPTVSPQTLRESSGKSQKRKRVDYENASPVLQQKDNSHHNAAPRESVAGEESVRGSLVKNQALEIAGINSSDAGEAREGKPKRQRKEKRKDKKAEELRHKTAVEGILERPSPTGSPVPEDALPDETRHKKIKAKFERSSKVAAKLAKKAQRRDEGQNENVELEEGGLPELHGLVPIPQPDELADAESGSNLDSLPLWLRHPHAVSSSAKILFKDLGLHESTLAALERKGYVEGFAIQSAVLPLLLPGRSYHGGDICISAATGSGKTLAYALPMIEALRSKPTTKLRGIVVVPTRELVTQAREALELCATGSHLKIGTAVGSKTIKEEQALLIRKLEVYDPENYAALRKTLLYEEADLMNWDDEDEEEDELLEDYENSSTDCVMRKESAVDILICTPGRLVDHLLSTKGFTLQDVQWLVVDEADRLLDESFQQWIDVVIPALEKKPQRKGPEFLLDDPLAVFDKRRVQKVILSATMTRDISQLGGLHLYQPKLVMLEHEAALLRAASIAQNPEKTSSNTMFELPRGLQETAYMIKNIEEKPIHLLRLLEEIVISRGTNGARIAGGMVTRNPKEEDDFTSSSGSDDDASSTSSSSNSSNSSIEDTRSSDSDDTSSTSMSETDVDSNPDVQTQPPPSNTGKRTNVHGVLVFTNNNENATRLARLLSIMSTTLAGRIGSLTKSTATSSGRKVLAAFRSGKLSVLVASDRASRGLDIKDLAHVINYDMPSSLVSYVHRIGRSARAGMSGTATTFVSHHEARWYWNEIARSRDVQRAGPIKRVDEAQHSVSREEKRSYAEALKQLGQEAHGA